MSKDKDKCYLDLKPFYQCCCQCVMQVPIHKNDTGMTIIGWGCLLPMDIDKKLESGIMFDDDMHSCGCECFCDKRLFDAKYQEILTTRKSDSPLSTRAKTIGGKELFNYSTFFVDDVSHRAYGYDNDTFIELFYKSGNLWAWYGTTSGIQSATRWISNGGEVNLLT